MGWGWWLTHKSVQYPIQINFWYCGTSGLLLYKYSKFFKETSIWYWNIPIGKWNLGSLLSLSCHSQPLFSKTIKHKIFLIIWNPKKAYLKILMAFIYLIYIIWNKWYKILYEYPNFFITERLVYTNNSVSLCGCVGQ